MSSSSALEIQNGKVGIGVYPTEPSSALQVIGGINTDSISGSSQNFTNSTITPLRELLNYYEENGSTTITLSGIWASNPTVTASWCRVGSLVFIQTQAAAVSSTNA